MTGNDILDWLTAPEDTGMFVLSFADTGFSDESMRFGTREELDAFMDQHEGVSFKLRRE